MPGLPLLSNAYFTLQSHHLVTGIPVSITMKRRTEQTQSQPASVMPQGTLQASARQQLEELALFLYRTNSTKVDRSLNSSVILPPALYT